MRVLKNIDFLIRKPLQQATWQHVEQLTNHVGSQLRSHIRKEVDNQVWYPIWHNLVDQLHVAVLYYLRIGKRK